MEAKTLKERTKIGMERARNEGKQIGRTKTTKDKPAKRKLDNHKEEINKLLNLEVPQTKIAKKFNVCTTLGCIASSKLRNSDDATHHGIVHIH